MRKNSAHKAIVAALDNAKRMQDDQNTREGRQAHVWASTTEHFFRAAGLNHPAPRSADPACAEAFARMVLGVAAYVDAVQTYWTDGEPIGTTDYFIAPEVQTIIEAIRTLESAHMGKLDGGTVDAMMCGIAAAAAVDIG